MWRVDRKAMMANSLYVPDPEAESTLGSPWDEAFRTQRDVGLLVPINFHTAPFVSLKAACFSNNQYEDSSFQKCFSNLLAVGLRNYVIDAYWDAQRGKWSLCPAEIPPSSGPGSSTIVTSFTVSRTFSTSAGVAGTVSSVGLKRQDSSSEQSPESTMSSSVSSSGSSAATSSASPSESTTSEPTAVSSASGPGQTLNGENILFQLGDYNCTSTMTLNYLTSIFNDFLEATSTTTDAAFTHLVLNIHAASSWQHPNDPAQQPPASLLPLTGNLLNNVMNGNLSDELYTPSMLGEERSNLGYSWNDVDPENMPREGYYTVQNGSNGITFTDNGWPNEAYMEFRKFHRLIATFGTVDPQMNAYNQALDAATIFPNSTLRFQDTVEFSSSGTLGTGCLFDASTPDLTGGTNSSFAVAALPSTLSVPANPDLLDPIAAVANLTACGISPLLNHTLSPTNTTTASTNALPYAALTHSTLWSWAPGEPLPSNSTSQRCAAASPLTGRWHVVDCNTPLRIACQDPSSPYSWRISANTSASYASAASACPPPFTFSVPHTPLENAYLLAQSSSSSSSDTSSSSSRDILLNLNSLSVPACWVSSVNGTCPYSPRADTDRTRIVVVPTVAAVIIFVCAAATFFVKCASNRREGERGRRRRMVGGWEYEGVPS